MAFSIVIPSCNADNLRACVGAIRESGCSARIIVVDDGIEWGPAGCVAYLGMGIEIANGRKPFIFSRNVNIGINAAGDDDVLILNDDAVLLDGGIEWLADRCQQFPGIGAVSAAIKGSMQPEQSPLGQGMRFVNHHMISFVAVYIRREVINKVGLLDVRFTSYGYDDDDYCQRVIDGGYQLGVYDGCVFEHGDWKKSTYRSQPGLSIEPNKKLFIEKWGFEPGRKRSAA